MIWLLAASCLLPVGILLAVTVQHAALLSQHSDKIDDVCERLRELEESNERRMGL